MFETKIACVLGGGGGVSPSPGLTPMQKHDCTGLKTVKLRLIKYIFFISVWFKVLSSKKLFTN